MFHSCICLLLVHVQRFNILWEPIPKTFTNDSKTRITSPIKNIVCSKVYVYSNRWILMNQLPLARHTSTEHLQKSTLKYVEFVWTCILPTLFPVVIELVTMHVRTYTEPSIIHRQNILPTLWKILVLRESSINYRSSLTISTMWPRGLINHLILIRVCWYFASVFNKSLVRKVKFLRGVVTFLVSTLCFVVVA